MNVVGLDLSLSATGIATKADAHTFETKPRHVLEKRLDQIREHVLEVCAECDAVTIEILPVMRTDSGTTGKLGMVHGVVRHALWLIHKPVVMVAPSTLKKYATGKGNAPKEIVLQAAQHHLDYRGHDHNQADALWLRAIGQELVRDPLVTMPLSHREALIPLLAEHDIELEMQ